MTNVSSNWQDSLNHRLVNRLTRSLRQPGMMKMGMSQRIINGCDRFLNRLPLLNQQMQRRGNTNNIKSDVVPMVYAQPVSSAKEQGIESREHNFNSQPSVSHNQPSVPIIQRKLDPSQSLGVKPVKNAIISENKKSNKITPSLSLEAQTNQNPVSSSEIPLFSPQNISEELLANEEVSLIKEFTNISEQPLPIIEAKQQNYSLSASSLPVANPLNSLFSSKQTLEDNYSDNINSKTQENLVSQIDSTNFPIATTQPLISQVNLTELEISTNVSNSKNNQNQSTSSLPLVSIKSPINSTLRTEPLPLTQANNSSSLNSISHQSNLSKQNSKVSNKDSSSYPRVFASPLSPTETSVSSKTDQVNSKIDVDTLANLVERKLMRRLVIESERKGKLRWR